MYWGCGWSHMCTCWLVIGTCCLVHPLGPRTVALNIPILHVVLAFKTQSRGERFSPCAYSSVVQGSGGLLWSVCAHLGPQIAWFFFSVLGLGAVV